MPSNKDTLVNCALSWFRLLLIRAESEEWTDEFGIYLNSKDTDVQRTEEYLQVAASVAASDASVLCLYAQFLEKKRDFAGAEGTWARGERGFEEGRWIEGGGRSMLRTLGGSLALFYSEYYLRSLEADSKYTLSAILYGNFLLLQGHSEVIANTFLTSPSCEVSLFLPFFVSLSLLSFSLFLPLLSIHISLSPLSLYRKHSQSNSELFIVEPRDLSADVSTSRWVGACVF